MITERMTPEELSTLWFDDIGEKLDTDEDACIEHFATIFEYSRVEFLESIMNDGVLDPIMIVNEEGELGIGNGHHRFISALILGIRDVPVTIVDDRDMWIEGRSGPSSRSYSDPRDKGTVAALLSDAIDRMFV